MEELKAIDRELKRLSEDRDFKYKFARLMYIVNLTAHIKGWYDPPKSFGENILMLHTELSEIVEAYRQHGNATDITYSLVEDILLLNEDVAPIGKPEGVPIEHADLTIRQFDQCWELKIDLLEAIVQKAQFNLRRPFRHGNKVL